METRKLIYFPTCVSALIDYNFQQLACGHSITVSLTTSGHVFTMGGTAYGQLGNPQSDGKLPCLVQDKLVGEFVEEISCGAYHVAVLTSRSEVFTWGRGANGRLGHGDTEDRKTPTMVEALKDRHANRIAVCDSCYAKLKASDGGNASNFNRKVSTPRRSIDGRERLDRGETRTSRILLSPITEPVKYLEVKSAKPGNKSDSYSIVRASQVPSLLQLKDIAFPSSLSALQNAFKPVITPPQPQPQHQPQPPPPPPPQIQPVTNSRPASPYSRRPSPPRSATPVFSRGVIDSLKKTNELLNQEVTKLQNQVRSLKQKCEFQDAEIKKLQKNAQEAALLATEESSKCTVAKEVFKSIMSQLKEMTNKLPPQISDSETFKSMHAQVESFLNTNGAQVSESYSSLQADLGYDQQNRPDKTSLGDESTSKQDHGTEDHVDAAGVRDISQNGDSTLQDNNRSSDSREAVPQQSTESGLRSPTASKNEGKREVIEQFEPGVYVTVIQLQNGTKIFKRVRFSKRRFAEQQAEGWWKENKDRVLKKYSPAGTNSTPTGSSIAPTPAEENSEEAAPSS
ncbi:hypothetical protein F0562_000501 [Nyssa sinensis]|uniref:BRX domain-containing protein n=1 Tax=Nyssa sinensis TaxID=561372 RepID=A0A5J5C4H0_9ASTE|nr:hypothetical protein F0562_000501 [Nyssa sinensis]